ncbi:hypothetical protein GMLC_44420 [Geomonas limicola]|uniref:Flagellar protein FlgJ N-terminal domain-containing protein n=1 Tax=Geomonas limicola TaxID=2740186 RepID=A0A6V8NGU1_9BACT|nr:rod-binding protein [Geomonas limicola]GFO70863.1 hypothetical protein GMLC_44420 [Geomonas limicola]
MELSPLTTPSLPPVENRVPTQGKKDDPAKVKKVAQEFEAMFVGMMLKSMRETVGQDKLTGGGRAEETFRSMLDQEYATEATKSGGIGLAKLLEKELTKNGGNPAQGQAQGIDHAY